MNRFESAHILLIMFVVVALSGCSRESITNTTSPMTRESTHALALSITESPTAVPFHSTVAPSVDATMGVPEIEITGKVLFQIRGGTIHLLDFETNTIKLLLTQDKMGLVASPVVSLKSNNFFVASVFPNIDQHKLFNIFSMNVVSGELNQITENGIDINPNILISIPHNEIVFLDTSSDSKFDFFRLHVETGNLQQLTFRDSKKGCPLWINDEEGNEIFVFCEENANKNINTLYQMDVKTGAIEKILENVNEDAGNLIWDAEENYIFVSALTLDGYWEILGYDLDLRKSVWLTQLNKNCLHPRLSNFNELLFTCTTDTEVSLYKLIVGNDNIPELLISYPRTSIWLSSLKGEWISGGEYILFQSQEGDVNNPVSLFIMNRRGEILKKVTEELNVSSFYWMP